MAWSKDKRFRNDIGASDISHDELTRLRVQLACSGILKKEDRLNISACLGVLRDILDEARK